MTASRPAPASPPLQPDPGNVLVVEDERRLRDVLIANIREMGLDPAGVPTAEQAVHALERSPYSIALLDLNLPGMGGMDLAALIHRRWPMTQLIVLTGFGDLAAAKRAIRLDVVDFLTKPCGMDDLEVALSRARSRYRERWIASQPSAPREPRPEPPPQRQPLPPPPARPEPGAAQMLEDAEREMIQAALARHGGNRAAAAAELGISVRKLYYRLQQYQQGRAGE